MYVSPAASCSFDGDSIGSSDAVPTPILAATVRARSAGRFSSKYTVSTPCSLAVACGSVTDFDASSELESLIDSELQAVLTASGFTASQHVFDVRGTCVLCQPD